MRAEGPLSVARVTVGPERLQALVRVAPHAPLRTSEYPRLAEALLDALPGIARHSCECGSARGIVAELGDTELPHLLEHVALELMALTGSPRSLAGETTWDFAIDGHGLFHVSIGFDDDLAALAALGEAASLINGLIADPSCAVDPSGPVGRVAAARGA